MRYLRPTAPVCLWQAQKAVRKQSLLPRVEETPVSDPSVHRPYEATVKRRFRVCGAHLPLWKRPLRLDYGRGILSKMRTSGTTFLD